MTNRESLNIIPASMLIPLYESRLAHAQANYKYWIGEYSQHGDELSECSWRAAGKIVFDVWQKLNTLKQPGAVMCDEHLAK